MFGLSGLIKHFPYLGIFILLILGGIGLPLPEDTTLILCGFLVSNNILKPFPAFIVIYLGLLSADFFLYSVGKKYGRKIVTHKRFNKIISLETLSKLEDRFKKRGILLVMLGRQIIGLRAQFMLVSGVMGVSAFKFMIADAISSIFAIVLWGGIGLIGGNSLEIIRKDIKRIEHIGILLAIIILSIFLLVRYFKSRRDRTAH